MVRQTPLAGRPDLRAANIPRANTGEPLIPAVILAAGLGRRIAGRTDGGPKPLLDVGGRTLLDRLLDALESAGFRDAVVVTGHRPEGIRATIANRAPGLAIAEKWNAEYATANNIVSLLCARDAMTGGFCLLNSDIVFDASILADVATLDDGNWLVADGDESLGDEEMKIVVDDGGVVTRISKRLDPATSAGEYVGIARFDAAGAAALVASAERLVAAGRTDLYYEDAIDAAARELSVCVCWTRGRAWTEVDDDVDYARAVRVAAQLDAATP
jgi:choline kinase